LWTLLITYPLMVGIQVISARIGCVTGRGLAANLAKANSRGVTLSLVTLLLVANTINIGANLAAMADAMELVVGGPSHIYAVAFGMACLLLQVFIPYQRYVGILKWLTLTLFAYVGTVFAVHVPWGEALHGTLVPKIVHSQNYLLLIVAIFGTTISPYLFFWAGRPGSGGSESAARRHFIAQFAGGCPTSSAPDQYRYPAGYGVFATHCIFYHANHCSHPVYARRA